MFENPFKIKHIQTTAFHPQRNGSLERIHSAVKDLINTAMGGNENDCHENLKIISMAFNTAKHDGTGFSPFELTFGRKANLPSILATTPLLKYQDLVALWKACHEKYLRHAKEKIEKSKQKYKEKQDSKIVIPQHIFEPGDLVLIHNESKQNELSKKWNGPFLIVGKVNNTRKSSKSTLLLNVYRVKMKNLFLLMTFIPTQSCDVYKLCWKI